MSRMASHLLAADIPETLPTRALAVPLAAATTCADVGNKASNLARLAALGLPVPSGIVVTTSALETFLCAGSLHEPIDALCRDLASRSADDVRRGHDSCADPLDAGPPEPE
jgi:hypothetical protein